jgi:hypothetical protein
VNSAHHPAPDRELRTIRSRRQLAFNEQLCFFAPGSDATSTQGSFGWWAALALGLVIVPWALVGLTIWMLA